MARKGKQSKIHLVKIDISNWPGIAVGRVNKAKGEYLSGYHYYSRNITRSSLLRAQRAQLKLFEKGQTK